MRLKCISSLLALYSHDALVSRLELFTNKFKDRLVSMVMDVDTDVAIKSCQLMTHIYRYDYRFLFKLKNQNEHSV